MKKLLLWCDGSANNHRKDLGGAGAYLITYQSKEYAHVLFGFRYIEESCTNNVAELMGAIAGLEAIKEKCKVHIYTDSMYICSPLMGKIKSMEAKHFMKKGKPIKNRDYFIRLNQVYKHHEVTASHLYGHTLSHKEIDENKVVDKLAGYSFANKLSGEFVITVRRSEYSSDTLWAIYHGTKLHFNQEWCDTKPFLRRRV